MKRLAATLFGIALACASTPIAAQDEEADDPAQAAPTQTRQHRLKIAQNTNVNFTNDDVDEIFRKITGIIQKSNFPWDVPCLVEFVRDGDVINHAQLPVSGTATAMEQALKSFAPQAHVLIVFTIDDCSGGKAAGCAPLGGGDRMVINTDTSTRGAIIWLHERGHVMRLDHVAEGAPSNGPDTEWGRTMFWNPNSSSTGVSVHSCNAFRSQKLNSIKTVNTAALEAASTVAMAAPPTYGLTEVAYRVLDSTFAHGVPEAEVAALSQEDLDSIRTMLQEGPNELWSRAIRVIEKRGDAKDIPLLARIFNIPLPAPVGAPTAEDRARARNLTEIKLTLPDAIGELSRRTRSGAAIPILNAMAHTSVSARVAGPSLADAVSRAAVSGLAATGHELAAPTLNAATSGVKLDFEVTASVRPSDLSAPLPAPLASDVPVFSAEESSRLLDRYNRARQ